MANFIRQAWHIVQQTGEDLQENMGVLGERLRTLGGRRVHEQESSRRLRPPSDQPVFGAIPSNPRIVATATVDPDPAIPSTSAAAVAAPVNEPEITPAPEKTAEPAKKWQKSLVMSSKKLKKYQQALREAVHHQLNPNVQVRPKSWSYDRNTILKQKNRNIM